MMGIRPGTLALALFVASALGAQARKPPKECNVRFDGVFRGDSNTTHVQSFKLPSGQFNTFVGGGVDAVCVGSDQRVLADSAEQFGDEKRLILIGHARYTEKRLKLDADRMTYYTGEERILAEGNVVGRTSTGTRFTGPRANYLRAATGVRAISRLEADARPHVWLSPADAGGGGKDSVSVVADRVISENDSLVYAKGRVIIDRVDLIATADSAALDNGKETARLFYSPKIVGQGERRFTLVGEVIEAWSKQRELERVKSGGAARATSDEITLTADTIDLRLRGQKLDRAFAWGGKRALAHAAERDIAADSLDIVMPNQVIREMRAVRNASAESDPDSLKIVSRQKDWLRGDTIIARFDSVAAGDTANKPAVRQITASGSPTSTAKSFYQVAPGHGEKVTSSPNVNYVTGRQIVVDFHDRQVQTVRVKEKAAGFYLEALPDSAALRAGKDSTDKAATPPAKRTKP
jgi:hypothetical protein